MVKLNKDARHMLELTLQTLDYALEMAAKKDDMEAVMGVADRMLALFQLTSEIESDKRTPAGFHLATRHEDDGGGSE